MKIAVGPIAVSPDEPEFAFTKDFTSVPERNAPDASSQRLWHADMQDIGLRLATKVPAPLEKILEPPPTRDVWSRLQQAYSILRGTAYARPLRQPRLLKARS